MSVWLKLPMADFFWLLGSFVASCDIVFDWYAMLRGIFIEQRSSTKDGWFGCSQIHGKHRGVIGSFDVRSVLQCGFCVIIGCWGKFLAVSRVLLRTLDECKCFDAWRKWSCRVVYVWPRTISDTIVCMFIWFCNLEWMIYRGTLIWCDLLKLKIYQVEGTVLVSVRIKSTKKHIPLKKMMDHVQSCQLFI